MNGVKNCEMLREKVLSSKWIPKSEWNFLSSLKTCVEYKLFCQNMFRILEHNTTPVFIAENTTQKDKSSDRDMKIKLKTTFPKFSPESCWGFVHTACISWKILMWEETYLQTLPVIIMNYCRKYIWERNTNLDENENHFSQLFPLSCWGFVHTAYMENVNVGAYIFAKTIS